MTYSLSELESVAKELHSYTQFSNIICLEGEMGAGKTTLVEAFAKNLGLAEHTVSSPTFSIINEYPYDEKSLVHMDLYRLKNPSELLNIGFEDYVYSNNICIIEWHQIAVDLLPTPFILAKINKIDESTREIAIDICR
jgi:tRNA threonylcarbamoyladenosine biosynthesis protein TsaE